MMWYAGRYRIPEVLDMTVFDCALALGVDQHKRPNLPYGQARPEPELSVAERLAIPAGVMVNPGLAAATVGQQFDAG